MSPLLRTLINEFKNVVFAEVEVETQDKPTIVEKRPLLVNQDSKCDLKDQIHSFHERTVCFRLKAIDWRLRGIWRRSSWRNTRLFFEACQDQHQFLSILVTQNSIEVMKSDFFNEKMQQKEKTKDWGLEKWTQCSNLGKIWVWKSIWVPVIRLWELVTNSRPSFYCRIRVDLVLTQIFS